MVNVPYQEASWFDLSHKFDKNSVPDETQLCVTELLLQKVQASNCRKTFQNNGDLEKHIEKKYQLKWPGLG